MNDQHPAYDRPHHDDVPGYTWGFGTYGEEPVRRRRRPSAFWDTLNLAGSALLAMGILGLGYGLVLYLAVTIGNHADLWSIDLNPLVAYAFGIACYWFVTVLGAHRRAMFADDGR